MISRKKDFPVNHQVVRFDEDGRMALVRHLNHSSCYLMERKQSYSISEAPFEDDLPLSAYNITSGANLEILLQRYSLVIIDVVNGEEFELMVKASESILDGEHILEISSRLLVLNPHATFPCSLPICLPMQSRGKSTLFS